MYWIDSTDYMCENPLSLDVLFWQSILMSFYTSLGYRSLQFFLPYLMQLVRLPEQSRTEKVVEKRDV